jgi:DNA-binding response OmpR family regulator
VLPSETGGNGQYRILICEDDADIATLLKLMLENAGYQSRVARTAAQAKQLLEEGDYDAMTLDLALPDQDGISLLQELRQNPKTQDLPVIVVSVTAKEGQQELNGDAFGVIDWIQKPIEESLLIDRLSYALRQASGGRPRILHLEDDESVLQIVSSIVADTGQVVPARTIKEAKTLLERETFDLLILRSDVAGWRRPRPAAPAQQTRQAINAGGHIFGQGRITRNGERHPGGAGQVTDFQRRTPERHTIDD